MKVGGDVGHLLTREQRHGEATLSHGGPHPRAVVPHETGELTGAHAMSLGGQARSRGRACPGANGVARGAAPVHKELLATLGRARDDRPGLPALVLRPGGDVGGEVGQLRPPEGGPGEPAGVHRLGHPGAVVPHGGGHEDRRAGPLETVESGAHAAALAAHGVALRAALGREETRSLDRVPRGPVVLGREEERGQAGELERCEAWGLGPRVAHRRPHLGQMVPHGCPQIEEAPARSEAGQVRSDGAVADAAHPVAGAAALVGEHVPARDHRPLGGDRSGSLRSRRGGKNHRQRGEPARDEVSQSVRCAPVHCGSPHGGQGGDTATPIARCQSRGEEG